MSPFKGKFAYHLTGLLIASSAMAGTISKRTIYDFSARKDGGAKDWSLQEPADGATLQFASNGGRAARGSMLTTFDKTSERQVALRGPDIPMERQAFSSSRLVNVSIGGKAEGLPDHAFKFKIEEPLTLEVVGFEGRRLELECRSELPGVNPARVRVSMSKGFEKTQELALAKGVAVKCAFDLSDLAPFTRHLGMAEVSMQSPAKRNAKADIDVTFMISPLVGKAPDTEAEWDMLPSMDFSAWKTGKAQFRPDDCSATVATACAPEAFILRVEVVDNDHVQTRAPDAAWNEDSMQAAFDADCDKEWQPNNVGFGLNGHRVTEYAFALGSEGNVMSWRRGAYAPGLKTGEPPDMKGCVKIERDEKRHRTVYEIAFPWTSLGLEGRPAPASHLGFSLVVNDADKTSKRRPLCLFGGIADGKDPENYGKLLIAPR